MGPHVDVSSSWIVVLTWNGRQDTIELLDSLEGAHRAGVQILVVDNGSSDGTLAAVQDTYPWARTLQTGENLGYAGGNNRGIDYAIAQGAETICVLNNDTIATPDFLPPLIESVVDQEVAVSPDIRYQSDPGTSWFRGARLDRSLGSARHLVASEQQDGNVPFDTELLSGCCIVASSNTWRQVGGFDEDYFLIFEDSDWSMRARASGVRLQVVPMSKIMHKGSRSFRDVADSLGYYYFVRNGLEFSRRWLGLSGDLRFIRSLVIRPIAASVRLRAWRRVGHLSVFCVAGVLSFALRRFGRAGRIVSLSAQVLKSRSSKLE